MELFRINFDKEKHDENATYNLRNRSTKYLYTPSNELISPYYVMGLLNEDINDTETTEEASEEDRCKKYVVETLMVPRDIATMFKDQEVVIPTQIITDINGKLVKSIATPSEKLALLKDYKALINEYNLKNNVNIYSDYISLLMDQERSVKTLIK